MSKQKQPVISKQVLYKTKQTDWPKAASRGSELKTLIEYKIEKKYGAKFATFKNRIEANKAAFLFSGFKRVYFDTYLISEEK